MDLKTHPVPSGARLDSLTSLRFFAALTVVLHHTANFWPQDGVVALFGAAGWLGVTFFFILSGFVLMWGFDPAQHDPAQAAPDFLARRLARIYPLHLITLAVSLWAFLLFGKPLAGHVGSGPATLANALLMHDWLPDSPGVRQSWNGVSWSLACELFFYLCAPWLFSALIRWRRPAMAVAPLAWAALLGLAATATPLTRDILQYHPLPHLFAFALGALCALRLRAGPVEIGKTLALLAMIAPVMLYLTAVALTGAERNGAVMIQLFTPGAALFILASAASDASGRESGLRKNWLVGLGEASFALYMTHALLLGVFGGVNRLWPEMSGGAANGVRLLYIACAVALACAVHAYVERPIRRALLLRLKTLNPSVQSA